MTEILWGAPGSIFVEGLLPTLTSGVAGSKSLAHIPLEVCSFCVEGDERAEVRHRGRGERNTRTSYWVKILGTEAMMDTHPFALVGGS